MVGPFDNFMKDSTKFFSRQTFYGPWHHCFVKYTYDEYAVYDNPLNPPDMADRFKADASCAGSIKYTDGPEKQHPIKFMEYSIAFTGGVMIGVLVSSALWTLWIVFDIMGPLIRRMVLPIVKTVQCVCAMIMLLSLWIKTPHSTKLWCWWAAVGTMFGQMGLIALHFILACCVDKLEWMLCTCCPEPVFNCTQICCPDPKEV